MQSFPVPVPQPPHTLIQAAYSSTISLNTDKKRNCRAVCTAQVNSVRRLGTRCTSAFPDKDHWGFLICYRASCWEDEPLDTAGTNKLSIEGRPGAKG
ncbi:unnamed protein product [Arctogadus glacialis]